MERTRGGENLKAQFAFSLALPKNFACKIYAGRLPRREIEFVRHNFVLFDMPPPQKNKNTRRYPDRCGPSYLGKKVFASSKSRRKVVPPIFRGKAAAEREALIYGIEMSLLLLSLSLYLSYLSPSCFRNFAGKRKRQRCLRLSFTFPSAMLAFRRKIIFSSSRYACTHFRTFWARTQKKKTKWAERTGGSLLFS